MPENPTLREKIIDTLGEYNCLDNELAAEAAQQITAAVIEEIKELATDTVVARDLGDMDQKLRGSVHIPELGRAKDEHEAHAQNRLVDLEAVIATLTQIAIVELGKKVARDEV